MNLGFSVVVTFGQKIMTQIGEMQPGPLSIRVDQAWAAKGQTIPLRDMSARDAESQGTSLMRALRMAIRRIIGTEIMTEVNPRQPQLLR